MKTNKWATYTWNADLPYALLALTEKGQEYAAGTYRTKKSYHAAFIGAKSCADVETIVLIVANRTEVYRRFGKRFKLASVTTY